VIKSKKQTGIYKITSPTGRIYIGQSIDIRTRHRDYVYNVAVQSRLSRSFAKHGQQNHIFETIELCGKDELNTRERYWQEHFEVVGKNGLNCILTESPSKPRVYTEACREKMSKNRTGEKNHRYGKKLQEYMVDIIRNTHTGKIVSEETKRKRRESIGDKQTGGGNPRARKVVCTQTGKEWGCILDCAAELGMNRKTLNDQLIGRYRNKTSVVFQTITDGGI